MSHSLQGPTVEKKKTILRGELKWKVSELKRRKNCRHEGKTDERVRRSRTGCPKVKRQKNEASGREELTDRERGDGAEKATNPNVNGCLAVSTTASVVARYKRGAATKQFLRGRV